MKLSKQTLSILKNFATINQSFYIKEGNVISVMFDDCIFAKAVVDETFPAPVLIYDMNKLLGVLSLFKSPSIEFEEKHLTISEGPHTVEYRYADPFIVRPTPEVKAVPDKTVLKCEWNDQMLGMAQKAAALFDIKTLSVKGEDDKATLIVGTSASDTYKHDMGTCTEEFDYHFTLDNLKIMPNAYHLLLGSKKGSGLMHLATDKLDVQYWIAANKDSIV